MSEIYHITRSLSRDLCEKYHTFLFLKNSAGGPRMAAALGEYSLPASLLSMRGAARPGGRALQVSRPKDGRPHGADPTKYKSLSGECRRGRTLAGPSRSFCHSGATLIRLASLGTFPLEGGRLACDRKGRPYGFTKVHLSNRRAGEGTRPYGGKRTGSVGSAEPGAEVEPHRPQFSTYPGPSGLAGI